MVTFRNNNGRRNNFRKNDRNYKSNGERPKFNSSFTSGDKFQRKIPGRNNHNASKLIEKYSNLAREALSSGDKILSENYFQHADHFTRILNERESFRKERSALLKNDSNTDKLNFSSESNENSDNNLDDNLNKDINTETQPEAN